MDQEATLNSAEASFLFMSTVSEATEQLANAVAALIAAVSQPSAHVCASAIDGASPSWRERLWACPAETRLGVLDLAEALGRSKGFVYRLTRSKDIPHRKLDGELVFRAGDIREWVQRREEVQVTPRLTIVGRIK